MGIPEGNQGGFFKESNGESLGKSAEERYSIPLPTYQASARKVGFFGKTKTITSLQISKIASRSASSEHIWLHTLLWSLSQQLLEGTESMGIPFSRTLQMKSGQRISGCLSSYICIAIEIHVPD